jgi:hypothetical protein
MRRFYFQNFAGGGLLVLADLWLSLSLDERGVHPTAAQSPMTWMTGREHR